MDLWEVGLLVAIAVGSALGLSAIAWSLYSRFLVVAPPSRALVIFGRSSSRKTQRDAWGRASRIGSARYVVGGASFVFPWTHSYATLSLGTFDVDVPVRATLLSSPEATKRADLHLGAQVKISSDPEGLRAAAENLLGKSEVELRALVRSVIEGHVHSVAARLSPHQVESERERVAAEVQVLAATDLVAMGLVVQSLALKEILPVSSPAEAPAPTSLAGATPAQLEQKVEEVRHLIERLEARLEEIDRRARTPEILPLMAGLAGTKRRVADLR